MTARKPRGFTLIESLIVVAIVALLAGLAYPAYTAVVLKGRRTQARTAVLETLQQQERYMTQRNTYLGFSTDALGNVVPATATTIFKSFAGDAPTGAPYYLSAVACGAGIDLADCIQINAVPTHADSEAGTLWARSTGLRNCSGSAATAAPAPPSKTCWP